MKLLVHIGLGKTGSSSIQRTLEANAAFLKNERLYYLGEMFEFSPVKIYPWQKRAGTEEFYADKSQYTSLTELAAKTLTSLEKDGWEVAILSNEWLGGCNYEVLRNAEFIRAIKDIASAGHEVICCAYVRDHLTWSVSAYQQWGIKNKTTPRMLTFSEYTLSRPPLFADTLRRWKDASSKLLVYNYSRIADVAHHFLSIVLGLNVESCHVVSANKQATDLELFMRACLNEFLSPDKPIRDYIFDGYFPSRLLSMGPDHAFNRYEWYTSLLPAAADLEVVAKKCGDDASEINQYLVSNNQEVLSTPDFLEAASKKLSSPSRSEIIDFLLSLIFRLANENKLLRAERNLAKS